MADGIQNCEAVLFEERATGCGFRIGVARLNSERSLNSLTLDMIRLLDPMLQRWAAEPQIACVVLEGAGTKAFCAGGDVRSLRDSIMSRQGQPGPNPAAEAFFSEEYRLDHRIHTYPKPILIWGNGIVMGGGLGLMAGASHRVVTETSRIAMPEITIGLYPDVGGTWFLRRMPGHIGLYLALTGASLNGHDAMVVGLADFFINSSDRPRILEALAAATWSADAGHNRATLSTALKAFQIAETALPPSNVRKNLPVIEQLVAEGDLPETVRRITGYTGDDPWLGKAGAALKRGSPTSAALIGALWARGKHLSLADAFRLELIVSLQCCEHPDFAEGVRALLIDKDNQPNWSPTSLEAVTPALVEAHFQPMWSPWTNEIHPLADL